MLGFTTWAYALARTALGKMGATTYAVPGLVVLMSWLILARCPAGSPSPAKRCAWPACDNPPGPPGGLRLLRRSRWPRRASPGDGVIY